jgi:RNA polymerase sigma-70 factor (ECF subfamily)
MFPPSFAFLYLEFGALTNISEYCILPSSGLTPLFMKTTLSSLDDDTLVRQCQTELPYNSTSYEELVKRYQKPVFYMCRRYLAVESDAEDATQEVFMKVFHTLPAFEHRSAFKTWLFSIAINHCKTLLGKNQRFDQFHEFANDDDTQTDFEDEAADTAKLSEAEDERNCVQNVISKMREDERDVILLRFTSELSIEEISNVLGKQLSATKMAFYRTLEKFKALHEKYCT